MKEVLFWGATGQAKVLREAITGKDLHLVALVDNREVHSPFPGIPVLHGERGLDSWLSTRRNRLAALFAVVAIGGSRGNERLEILQLLKDKGLSLLTVIHSTAFVARDAHIEEGCQILAQSAVCTHVCAGKGVIVNTGASVDHDCILGDGVHVAPGACLAGEVIVEDCSFVGAGSVIMPRVRIGKNSIVGAGAVVTKDVPPGATVVGNPAREHKGDVE